MCRHPLRDEAAPAGASALDSKPGNRQVGPAAAASGSRPANANGTIASEYVAAAQPDGADQAAPKDAPAQPEPPRAETENAPTAR